LLPSAPPEVVRAAYKALAMKHHPDKGGSTELMQAINQAYERLRFVA
jgi:curved DNA-binding protein CbpA